MSSPENYDSLSQQMVSGLSDEALLSLVRAGNEEMNGRELSLPKSLSSLNVSSDLEEHLPSDNVSTLADGRLKVFHTDSFISIDGNLRPMRGYKFSILSHLAKNADVHVTHNQIYESIYNEVPDENSASRLYSRVGKQIFEIRTALGEGDLGHFRRGVIRAIPTVGWVAVTSLQDNRPSEIAHQIRSDIGVTSRRH